VLDCKLAPGVDPFTACARCTCFSDDFNSHLHTSCLRNSGSALPVVTLSMTTDAECNQIVRHIPTKLAPRLEVMNLQVLRGTAVLAAPTVSFQHMVSDPGIFFPVQLESRLLLAEAHRTRRIQAQVYGPVSSSLAPARKSAQIISRQ